MCYDGTDGEQMVFLGNVGRMSDATAGIRSAIDLINNRRGRNLRIEARDETGMIIFAAPVPAPFATPEKLVDIIPAEA